MGEEEENEGDVWHSFSPCSCSKPLHSVIIILVKIATKGNGPTVTVACWEIEFCGFVSPCRRSQHNG